MQTLLLRLVCAFISLWTIASDTLAPYASLDFQHDVVQSHEVVIVIYHGIARDENEELTGKVRVLSDEVNEKMTQPYGIQVKTVDCLSSVHKSACRNANIVVMPTVHVYTDQPAVNPYTKRVYRTPKIWETKNPNDIKALEKFVSKIYPNLVQRLDVDEDEGVEVTSGLHQLQSIVANNSKIPVTLLFTEKKTTTMLLKSVAVALQGRMTIVEVTNSVSTLISKYKVTKYPTVITIPATPIVDLDADKYVVFDENVKIRSELLAHLTTYASELNGASNPDGTKSTEDNSGIKKIGSNIIFTDSNGFSLDLLTPDMAWILAISHTNPDTSIPDWNKIKRSVEGSIAYAELYCTDAIDDNKTGTFFCQALSSTPYIVVLPFGENERKKLSIDNVSKWKRVTYVAEEAEDARKAAGDSLPDTEVVEISDDSFNDFITDILNNKLLPVTVISDKPTPSSMLKNLGLSLSKYIKVSFMSTPSAAFLSSLGNPRLPAVIATHLHYDETGQLKSGANGMEVSMALYDTSIFGPMKYSSIQNFVLQIHARSGLQSPYTEATTPIKESVQSSEVQKEIIAISTPDDWERECSPSYRGICVIALYDSTSSSYNINYMGTVMNSIINKMGRSVAAFRVLAADAYCQVSFTEIVGISITSIPTVIIYSPMKGRYASFRGAFNEQAVQEFLDGVLNGRMSTGPLSQRPVFSPACQGSVIAANNGEHTGNDDESDSLEFLEEIKREEIARKLRLKQELEEEKKRVLEEEARAEEEKASRKRKKRKKSKRKTNSDEL